MMANQDLATRAAAGALRVRVRYGRELQDAICPYDLALDMGLELRFVHVPSLEGVYCADDAPRIVLNSLRPPGRRAYSCGHEIGHHFFGHGTRIDELVEGADDPFDPYEYLADRFASALLMPKLAVDRAFAVRNWSPSTCTPIQMFTIAGYFGVGYTTLIGYLEGTLQALSGDRTIALRRMTPKSIRRQIFGVDIDSNIVIVDEHWDPRPVDVEVGDLVVLPPTAHLDGKCLVEDCVGSVRIARGATPGIGEIRIADASLTVRVSRRNYCGLAEYRHLEDPDEQ